MSLSLEDRERVVLMTHERRTAPEIAAAIGCSTRTVQRIRVAAGVGQPLRPAGGRPISQERLDRIGLMIADSMPHAEIARSAGVSGETLRRHSRTRGGRPRRLADMAA